MPKNVVVNPRGGKVTKDMPERRELRCNQCGKLLAYHSQGGVEVKCARCRKVNSVGNI